jgi:hypothetical protein
LSHAVARSWRSPTADAPPPADRRERVLDPEVLERYLLLLSLEVETQRIREEQQREMAEIDARLAAQNALVGAPAAEGPDRL